MRLYFILFVFLSSQLLFATDHHVGPGQPLSDIADVPWDGLVAGDNVYIHWRSTSYKEKWVINALGTSSDWISIIGVSGPNGEQPIIDGNGAITPTYLNYWNEKRSVIKVGGSSIPNNNLPSYILIENLEIKSAYSSYSFTNDNGGTETYANNAAAIHVEKAAHLIIRNCTLHDSGNGLFISASDGETEDILIEHNHLHGNGIVGSAYQHNSYTAAIDITFQYNHYGPLRTGADGNNLKDRSAGLVVRNNWIESGNRQLDLVDAEDSQVLVNHPSYHTTHVYGNILIEPNGAGNSQIIHYGGDSGTTADYRKGTLYFYNNTIVSTRNGFTTLMRLSTNDETAEVFNNVIYTTSNGSNFAMMDDTGVLNLHHDWLKTGWVIGHGSVSGTFNDLGNNITGTDPSFVDEAGQDYKLQSNSTCVDNGDVIPASLLPDHNIANEYLKHQQSVNRAVEGSIDIGAHEYFINIPDCNCTLDQVNNNTVTPCDFTIGTVVNVTTEAEFLSAVNQANNSGGNMTILIADGTYQISSTSSYPYITANDVVFRSQSGNRDAVILTGGGMVDVAPDTEIGIYAVGDNITIADVTLKDFGNHAIAVTGDNLYVHNVKIQNTYEQMVKGNSTANGITNGKVQCSLLEYTAGVGPQWYIGGLDIHAGHDWNVNDNVFKYIASPSVSLAEHAVHFWDDSSNNIVERNMILNCDRGIGFGLGSSPNDGGVIKNNMIRNDGSAMFDDVGISLETSPNTEVYNNTVIIDYPNAIEYRFTATINVEIANNLTNRLIKQRNGATATLTTNETNGLLSWFIDPSIANLRLASNVASVVDMATTYGEVAVDIDQTDRPQQGSYDIGAHEYSTPLAVELLQFGLKLEHHNKGVRLGWVTNSEMDNWGFEIQRLNQENQWSRIGWEDAKTTHTSNIKKYAYLDKKPNNGLNYYRLKQYDFAGTTDYSEVRSIVFNPNKVILKVFPNPAVDMITIDYLTNHETRYTIYDNMGRMVKNDFLKLNNSIDISSLKKGSYYLVIKAKEEKSTALFIKY